MNGQRVLRGVVASLFALLVLAVAAPAQAQMGSVKGKVVDRVRQAHP